MESTMIMALAFAALTFLISMAKLSKKSKDNKNKTGPAARPDKQMLTLEKNKSILTKQAVPAKCKRANEVSSTSLASIEDREHDWLARQLREEAASERRFSAMYGLKQAHKANCPARSLREEHRSNCDADGVDVGRGK